VRIYDLRGHTVFGIELKDQLAGNYTLRWETLGPQGKPLSSGIYLARFQVGNQEITKKILLIR
jgi:hypothetical protein